MSQEQATVSVIDEVRKNIRSNTPELIVEAIVSQLSMAREARKRIDEEGIVVRDMKGSVIAHPAIKIELTAMKTYTEIVAKYRKM